MVRVTAAESDRWCNYEPPTLSQVALHEAIAEVIMHAHRGE
jgi:hypothetical protein